MCEVSCLCVLVIPLFHHAHVEYWCVQPVVMHSDVFCLICSVLMLNLLWIGDHVVEAYSSFVLVIV